MDEMPMRGHFLSGIIFAFLIFHLPAFGDADLDRKFKFESIGLLRSDDNIDGLFADYTQATLQDYFSHQSRFTAQSLDRVDALLTQSKIPYSKLIYDTDILKQIAGSARVETLLRTRILKTGPRYSITLDWLHATPTNPLETMSTVQYTIPEPEDLSTHPQFITQSLPPHLDQLLAQIPFKGMVTGRDQQSVTVNIGSTAHIKKGDILVVSTLDEVKRHPLLKTVVDWKMSTTGKLEVEQTEDSIAFCRIIEESLGRTIDRYQKITQIQEGAPLIEGAKSMAPKPIPTAKPPATPSQGWMALGFQPGSQTRQFSSLTGPVSNSGSGFTLGAKADAEIWLTKEWFADVESHYSFWNFMQKDNATNTPTLFSQSGGVGASAFSFKLNIAYSYLLNGDFFGPRGWLKLGYKNTSYQLPISLTENTGPISYGSVFVGIGGDYPIRGNWGVLAEFNIRLFTSVSKTWFDMPVSGSSDVDLRVGAYYRFTPHISLRTTFEMASQGVDFEGGSVLTQKLFTITPSLLYYF